jgi:hypothetical protein
MAMDEFSKNVGNSGSSGSGGNNDDNDCNDDVDDDGYYGQGGSGGGGGRTINGSDEYIETQVDDVFINDVQPASSYTASSESNSMMTRAYLVNYDFNPADDTYFKK